MLEQQVGEYFSACKPASGAPKQPLWNASRLYSLSRLQELWCGSSVTLRDSLRTVPRQLLVFFAYREWNFGKVDLGHQIPLDFCVSCRMDLARCEQALLRRAALHPACHSLHAGYASVNQPSGPVISRLDSFTC